MSNEIRFDRRKGFIALPIEVLEIDLSPGAFRTLVELCRMANVDGYCWPSLGQLSDRLGRSRSAISGYLKELRGENLIETEEQRTANGYNYRLKYRVTFWASWRTAASDKPLRKDERSVRSTERPKENKNQIHQNQTPPATRDVCDDLILEWAEVFKGAPYPTANRPPSAALLGATDKALSKQAEPVSEEYIRGYIFDLWKSLNLANPETGLETLVKSVRKQRFTSCEFAALLKYIRGYILPHWRKVPTETQFAAMLKSSGIRSLYSKKVVLQGFEKRWKLAEKSLCRRAA